MKHTHRNLTKALIFTTAICAIALPSTTAMANDGSSQTSHEEAQTWTYKKTAVSPHATVIRVEEIIPQMIVPLNTNFAPAQQGGTFVSEANDYDQETDLSEFDLVEDSPIFIGAKGASEYDTRDAQYDTGAYPKTLGIDPLYTVAGAGVATSF
jgi:hypothetical protein